MSDDRGPVHYQISMTGRQAGAFFLALLAALGLSFFFGMKTGSAAKKGPETVAALVAASDLPVPTIAADERKPSRPDESAAARTEDRKLGFDTQAAAEPKKTATPEPTPKPAAPAAAPAPKPTATKAPVPTPTKKEGPLWVQVLATKNAATADDLAKRLKEEGFAADVAIVPGKPGWFRVRVGPYNDRAKAEAAATKIQKTDKQIKNKPLVTP